MVSRTRWLLGSASSNELGHFTLVSGVLIVALTVAGGVSTRTVAQPLSLQPELSRSYVAAALHAGGLIPLVGAVAILAARNHRLLRNIHARCELADDEIA